MDQTPPEDVRRLLETLRGDEGVAGQRLFEDAYGELRHLAGFLMRREPPGHTLQATALVHEAYLKLVGNEQVDWNNQRHFINTAARAMRQVLIDRARRHASEKYGGHRRRVTITDVDVGTADTFPIERMGELAEAVNQLSEANARWGELVHLRFYAGLTIEQTAEIMGISPALVNKDWRFARAWLANVLDETARA
ncbi:MAG: ECF-type sigma factor [Planctomycetota bacterium]|jgi:RNA polymerase sigma factor (TIGR02999 family)